jgi:integrase
MKNRKQRKKRYGDGVIDFYRGKWRLRMSVGGKYKYCGSFDTWEDAEEERKAALALLAGKAVGLTLKSYAVIWFKQIATQRNLRTWKSTWGTVVSDAQFIDWPLTEIEPPDVRAWARSLPAKLAKRSVLANGQRKTIETDRTISRQTQLHALGMLRRCLTEAVGDGYITSNPAEDVELPKITSQHQLPVFLPNDEVELLFSREFLPIEQRTVFTLAIFQGLREGEIAGLDWSVIDWDAPGLTVAASWNGAATKTARTRWQAMLPATLVALREWWIFKGQPSSGLVFPSSHRDRQGKVRTYTKGHDWGWSDHKEVTICRLGWWRRCGLKTQVTFHMLRDTCASHLLSGTWGEPWEIKRVSVHIGHTSVAVTEKRYAHLTRDALLAAARKTRGGTKHGAHLAQGPENPEEMAQASGFLSRRPEVRFLLGAPPVVSQGCASPTDQRDAPGLRQLFEALTRAAAAFVRAESAGGAIPARALLELGDAACAFGGDLVALGEVTRSDSPHAYDRAGDIVERLRDVIAAASELYAESEAG